jgi:perosamine synthetase
MIPQIEPWIDDEELKEITEVIKSTWVTEASKTKKFEEMFKELARVKYARTFCNGTVTLFTAMKVLGIKKGDEVIVPNLTFIASVNSIIFSGAKPVLVDIDKKTFNIDPEKIEEKITKKTKAIMPVHLYGQSCDMDKIMEIAKKHNLYVIEDAAQGIGVKYNDKHVGSFGEYGSFSFYGNKTITTGEGGMLITNDEKLDEKALRFKNHGRMGKGFIHDEIGFNFNFTEMQAALGISQLNKLNRIIERKKKIREIYMKHLSGIEGIEFPLINPKCSPVHWFTNILVKDAGKLEEGLKKREIQTRRFFYPINKQPCYNIKENFPNSEWAYNHGISLPSSVTLKDSEIKKICETIKKVISNN